MPRKRVIEAEGVTEKASSLAEPVKKPRARRAKAPAKPVKAAGEVQAPESKAAPLAHEPTQEEIAHLAYQFWMERGCQHGHDAEDWERAERELRARYRAAGER